MRLIKSPSKIFQKIFQNKRLVLLVVLFLLASSAGLAWYFKSRLLFGSESRKTASTGIKKGVVEFFDTTPTLETKVELEQTDVETSTGTNKSGFPSLKGSKAPPKMQRVPKLNAFIPADIKVQELTTQTIDKLEKSLYGMASGDVIEVQKKGCKLKLSSFVALEAEKKSSGVERTFYFLPPGTNLYLSYPPAVPGTSENPFKLKVGERILVRVSLSPGGKEAVLLKIEGRKTK